MILGFYSCYIYLERSIKSNKAMYRLVFLRLQAKQTTRSQAKGTIFKLLLQKIIYKILLLLLII